MVDWETGGQGDKGIGRQGDGETGGWGDGEIRGAALDAVTGAGGGAMFQRILSDALLTAVARVGIDRIYRILIASNLVDPVNRVQCSAHDRMGIPASWLIC